jgi:Mor family transcriptional regulator
MATKKLSGQPPTLAAAIRQRIAAEYLGGAAMTALADRYDIGIRRVRQVLVEQRVPIRRPGSSISDVEMRRRDARIAREYARGALITDLAERYELGTSTIHLILSRQHVPRRGQSSVSPARARQRNERIVNGYQQGKSVAELAKRHGMSSAGVEHVLKRRGVYEKQWSSGGDEKRRRDARVIAAYRRGASAVDLAQRFNLARQTIYQILWNHGEQGRWHYEQQSRIRGRGRK